jgi:hypothetical protein
MPTFSATFQTICPPDPSVTGRQRRYPVRTRAPPTGAALPFPSFVTLFDSRHPNRKGAELRAVPVVTTWHPQEALVIVTARHPAPQSHTRAYDDTSIGVPTAIAHD